MREGVIAEFVFPTVWLKISEKDVSFPFQFTKFAELFYHLCLNRRLVSSVGRAPDCSAGGRGFEPQTGPTLRVLK